jgi:hypothetical protein
MYNCPNFEVPTIKPNGRSLDVIEAQFSNGNNIGTKDNKMVVSTPTNDLSMMTMDLHENQMKISELNSNRDNTNDQYEDDEDDMILSQEQMEELFSSKTARRTGLKSAFFRWPEGIVPFQMNSSFCKTFVSLLD